MRYLSVCAGIEAATVAWHDLGWQAAAFSEIEPFPSAVLKHHYPDVPNVGDMTKFKEWDIGTINLLVGGTPCQSFSVAGLRKGLDDPRGNLMLTYLAIAAKHRPRWLVWENVPGVLSSNGGKDFATFLGALGELGYGFAYRVLDAQYFGVAQRRRRVFVVGCLGDWRSAAAVLFERESLSRNLAPSREKKQEVAKTLTRGIAQRYDPETETMISTYSTPAIGNIKPDQVASCISRNTGAGGETQNPAFVVQPSYGIPGNWIGRKPENGGNAIEQIGRAHV
jgi:DNA (cytosine-5)-methyltransferase 1